MDQVEVNVQNCREAGFCFYDVVIPNLVEQGSGSGRHGERIHCKTWRADLKELAKQAEPLGDLP